MPLGGSMFSCDVPEAVHVLLVIFGSIFVVAELVLMLQLSTRLTQLLVIGVLLTLFAGFLSLIVIASVSLGVQSPFVDLSLIFVVALFFGFAGFLLAVPRLLYGLSLNRGVSSICRPNGRVVPAGESHGRLGRKIGRITCRRDIFNSHGPPAGERPLELAQHSVFAALGILITMLNDTRRLGTVFSGGLLGGAVVSAMDGGAAGLGTLMLLLAALYSARTAASMEWTKIRAYGTQLFLPILLSVIGYGFVSNPKPIAEPYAVMGPEPPHSRRRRLGTLAAG